MLDDEAFLTANHRLEIESVTLQPGYGSDQASEWKAKSLQMFSNIC